jgi:hypothetical protein
MMSEGGAPMPLHDWNDTEQWEMLHYLWIAEVARWLKPKLPTGYRTFIGRSPVLTVDIPGIPDAGVRNGAPETNGESTGQLESDTAGEPDYGPVQVAQVTLAPDRYVYVAREGRLVAAVEIVSPANKDRPSRRAAAAVRYAAYLQNGVHLLLIDLLPRPTGFSFADAIAEEVGIPDQEPLPPPFASGYHVGERSAAGESTLEIWRRPLAPGQLLPTLPLWLDSQRSIPVDLEATYMRAAADAYLA